MLTNIDESNELCRRENRPRIIFSFADSFFMKIRFLRKFRVARVVKLFCVTNHLGDILYRFKINLFQRNQQNTIYLLKTENLNSGIHLCEEKVLKSTLHCPLNNGSLNADYYPYLIYNNYHFSLIIYFIFLHSEMSTVRLTNISINETRV